MNGHDIFARRLRKAMNGKSANWLALKTDIYPSSIGDYLHGHFPAYPNLFKICDALHTKPDYLLGYDNSQQD